MSIIRLVEDQISAYRDRDITNFCKCYREDIEIYTGDDLALMCRNKDDLEQKYTKYFEESEKIEIEILERKQIGQKIIDHEKVKRIKKDMTVDVFEAFVVYYVSDFLIYKVVIIK